MKKQLGNKIQKILIIRNEHIGDYALSLPAIKAVRDKFPNSRIDIVVGPWNKDFAKATPYVDKTIVFSNPPVKRNLTHSQILKSAIFDFNKFRKFFKKTNKEDYDLLISFSDRKYNKLFLKFINSKKKISGVDFDFGELKEGERIKKICEKNGLRLMGKANLNYSKKDKEIVDRFLKSHNIEKKGFFILHPLSPLKEKNWSLGKWKEVINSLNVKTIVIGIDEERLEIEEKICEGSDIIFNGAGIFNIVQTAYLISKSKRFLGIDSGPMHLAGLSRIPIVTLFGPTNEKIWGPVGNKDRVIKKENIKDISVDEVLEIMK